MCEVLKKIFEGVNDLEERMCEYSEMNPYLFSFNKMYMITSNHIYDTPEYNHQPYTFKYGDYTIGDYIKNYT